MKQLLVLRHAKSSWKDMALSDFDRPLNKRGYRDGPRMGMLLAEQGLIPDQIISSAAKRARLTAEAVAENCGYEKEIDVTRILYMAMPYDYISVLQQVGDSTDLVMVVGHNPGIEQFVEDLVDEWHRMPTAALAYIILPVDHWQSLDRDTKGELLYLWRPKEL